MSDVNSNLNTNMAAQSLPTRTPKGNPTMGQSMAPAETGGSTTSGLSVGSQVVVGPIKPVDSNSLEGTNKGNHNVSGDNAKTAMDAIANPPGPREQMRGQQNTRNYSENGKGFKSNGNNSDSDGGN